MADSITLSVSTCLRILPRPAPSANRTLISDDTNQRIKDRAPADYIDDAEIVAALLAASTLIKYLWPMRRMRAADVSPLSLAAGAVLGIIGFFVIPVLGLVIGFVLGVYLTELCYRRDQRVAWTSTVHALKAVALSVGVELCGALLATMAWVAGVYLTN